ncbi:hypothetical protein [Undibacterium sp. YM2]|uniref:hypothetical protein n=1 Tax=Undibacterium sp. YM2 TaxID=2058625 RepID=UPI00138956BE|nr:hypothetical protein [Undibacterium sp. YM2]
MAIAYATQALEDTVETFVDGPVFAVFMLGMQVMQAIFATNLHGKIKTGIDKKLQAFCGVKVGNVKAGKLIAHDAPV